MNETWWLDQSQLDPTQMDILTEPPEADLLILGPPGSGKTNILVLRANYIRTVAPRLLLLSFTRTLVEFLRSGRNVGRADQIQQSEISTFMGWCKKLIHDHGGTVPDETGDFPTDRHAAIEEVRRLIAIQGIGKLYDVIFIDEVQDCVEEELLLVKMLARRVNAAGDARQEIWKHREGLGVISSMTTTTKKIEKHYRVGYNICDLADQILPPKAGFPPMTDGCNYPESVRPSSVKPIPSASLSAQFSACLDELREQRRYISDEPIGVMTSSRETRDAFWDVLEKDGELGPVSMIQHQDDYQPFGPDNLIRLMTVHSAKGSEFRAVHLLEADKFGTNRLELAFTAVTRAKTEVTLYHVKPLRGHMRPPADALPPIASIF